MMKRFLITVSFLLVVATLSAQAATPLASWHEGKTKQSIVGFVEDVTTKGSPNFVPVAERIAVFDNDGTLWAEQPMYFQIVFALDRVKALAPQHPEWKNKEPFKSALAGDVHGVLKGGKKALLELMMATHAGNTVEEFDQIARNWLANKKHATTGRLHTEMVYQPMLELLDYLRENGFKTYITSGGGIEFIRAFAQEVYDIPPEQVIGSSIKTEFKMRADGPVLERLPELNFNDDKEGKPVAINQHIGRRPIAAFGNSDGDHQMLQWTVAGEGKRLALLVHHTDGVREWAYDKDSHIGRLNKALVEAREKGWTVVDMKRDWKVVFPPK